MCEPIPRRRRLSHTNPQPCQRTTHIFTTLTKYCIPGGKLHDDTSGRLSTTSEQHTGVTKCIQGYSRTSPTVFNVIRIKQLIFFNQTTFIRIFWCFYVKLSKNITDLCCHEYVFKPNSKKRHESILFLYSLAQNYIELSILSSETNTLAPKKYLST